MHETKNEDESIWQFYCNASRGSPNTFKCNTKNKMYETHNLNILISINKVWIILHCFSSLNLDIPLNKFMSPLAYFFPSW